MELVMWVFNVNWVSYGLSVVWCKVSHGVSHIVTYAHVVSHGISQGLSQVCKGYQGS